MVGPKCKALQAVLRAAPDKNIKICFTLRHRVMSEVELWCMDGVSEPFWHLLWLDHAPYCQTLGEVADEFEGVAREGAYPDVTSVVVKANRKSGLKTAALLPLVVSALDEMFAVGEDGV